MSPCAEIFIVHGDKNWGTIPSKCFECLNSSLAIADFSIMGHGEDEGIIPRFSDELFQKIESLKENSDDVVRVVFCCPKFVL